MTFLSLLVALLLEQLRPLRSGSSPYAWFGRHAARLERNFNAGGYRHGAIGWALAVAPPVIATLAVFHALKAWSPLLGILWSVAVLYLTMGFRRFSHYFTEIQQALRSGEIATARERLGRWRRESADELEPGEIARVAIEEGLLAAHRQVFGTIAWFVALGPGGAVLYRLSALLAESWGARGEPEFGEFGRFPARVFFWLDWVPARLTAASFAVVGNFEDAVYCWRNQAPSWDAQPGAVILASGGGALGVRLGSVPQGADIALRRPGFGLGEEAGPDHMQSAAGLAWRALVVWMFLILLVSIARALG